LLPPVAGTVNIGRMYCDLHALTLLMAVYSWNMYDSGE